VSSGKGQDGPDTRTCARLVQHLLDSGEVQLARLQYNQELVATTREVGAVQSHNNTLCVCWGVFEGSLMCERVTRWSSFFGGGGCYRGYFHR